MNEAQSDTNNKRALGEKPKEAFVSIIIPVYNAERYVRDALDSVRAQSIPDWEVICVNDGSKDRSAEILEDYARQDARIWVIHQRNSGVSNARNRALARITGGDAYFTFLDADDAWASSYLAKFMTALLVGVSPPDIVSLGSMYVPEDFDWRTHPLKDSQREECFYGAEVCLLRMWSSPTCPFAQVTDKFWRAEVFRNNRFLAGMRYGEDSIFVWEASLRATSLVESGYRGYFYRSNPTSAVNTPHRVAALQEWYLKTKIVLHLATQLRPRQEWATPIFSYSAFFGQRLKWFLPWCQRKSIVFQLSPAFLSYLGTRKGRLVYWMQLMLRFSALLVMLVPLGVANLLGKWRWIR